jgi:hypothetical protein
MTNDENLQAGWSAVPGGTLRATKLLRVVSVVQSCAIENGDLTIASMELYEDGCLLRCHLIPNEDTPPAFEPGQGQWYWSRTVTGSPDRSGPERGPARAAGRFPQGPVLPDDRFRLRLEDDAGTSYAGMSRGGGGDSVRWETTYGFVPAVPDAATTLRVSVHAVPSGPSSGPTHVFEVRV